MLEAGCSPHSIALQRSLLASAAVLTLHVGATRMFDQISAFFTAVSLDRPNIAARGVRRFFRDAKVHLEDTIDAMA